MWFANIFFHSVVFNFADLFFFSVQKLFSLIYSPYLICFVAFAFGVKFKLECFLLSKDIAKYVYLAMFILLILI